MDAVANLFALSDSPEFLMTMLSIALAAVVFFYFVHRLRQEETLEHPNEDQVVAEAGAKMHRHA